MFNSVTNQALFRKRIADLNLFTPLVIIFDFDELAIPIHLSRTITDKISKPIDEQRLKELGDASVEGIRYIQSRFQDYDYDQYCQLRNRISKETPFRTGFKELLTNLQTRFSIIFITSGLKDICLAKLSELNFDPANVIGGELNIKNNKINGSNLIITAQMKGEVVTAINKQHQTLAIGHSLGDKFMLDQSTVSIALNSKIPNLADYNVNSVKELQEVIERSVKNLTLG